MTFDSPVAVVIVNHNAGESLALCLESVLSRSPEVVLVDNASDPPGFESVVAKFAGNPSLKIIRSPVNTGFAVACNKGASASSAPFVLFLNPDCVAPPCLLKKMRHAFDANARTGMVGAMLLNPDGTEQGGGRRALPTPWKSFVRAFGLWRLLRRHDFHMSSCDAPLRPTEVDAISGACMMVRRAAFLEVGGFDEGFFLHCEDLDLCLEFKKHGWSVVFNPSAIVLHGKGVCSRSRPVFVEWHKHRGMLRFYAKHFKSRYPAILRAFVGVAVWLRFAMVAVGLGTLPRPLPREKAPRASSFSPRGRRPGPPGVGVLGASSFVGRELLQLMEARGVKALPFSRSPSRWAASSIPFFEVSASSIMAHGRIGDWISLAPIHVLVTLLPLLELAGVRRLVAISSTSKFTKIDSADASERRLAARLDSAERRLQAWGRERDVGVCILRTTMIYDGIHDANIAAIAGFVRRHRWYPVLGPACGLRQPLHARDLASACLAALELDSPSSDYNISGGETLTYREMVERIFESQGLPCRLIAVPAFILRMGVPLLRMLPRFRYLSFSMFQRMNHDLVFGHSMAARDLDFRPGSFQLNSRPHNHVLLGE